MNVDLAIKSRQIEVWVAVFSNNNPVLFNKDNPRVTLDLSIMDREKRKAQVNKYLGGLNPVGFTSLIDLNRPYTIGVSIDAKKIFGFEAIAHMLGRHLAISTEKVEEMLTKAYNRGFVNIIFLKRSNSRGCETLENDRWIIKKKEVPSQDVRNQRLNRELAKVKSKFRCRTSKTYTVKTYGV